ncbi:MAG: flagellar hook basal-body protein [Labilithrix sp.]|nr:flagellar hook basal-body protein [Labilithrix sp.]MCW5817170.1 flagellar hook basal-body protein [Labilithrix sp.]
MSRGLYVALSGAVAQEQALEATAQNMANATTAGYQKMRPIFNEALRGATRSGQALHYGAVNRTALDTTRGPIRATGNPADIALKENEYLAVTTARGERYTRAGDLKMGTDGVLRAAGQPLVREDGKPIQLSPSEGPPAITADGQVTQKGAVVAQLKVVRPNEGTTFVHEGNGVLASRGNVSQVANPEVELGVVEESNASVVSSMTDMVQASRTFDAFKQMLDTFSECDRKVLTTTPGATE